MIFDFSTAHGWLRAGHVIPGFVGLAAFWVPLLTKKGGRAHRACGWVFTVCAAVVIGTALTSAVWALVEPISFSGRTQVTPEAAIGLGWRMRFFGAFLGALAFYTLPPLVLAIRVVTTRKQPERLAVPWVRGLVGSQYIVGLALFLFAGMWWQATGWTPLIGVPLFLGAVGFYAARDQGRFLARPAATKMNWWYKHMEYMLTCGIAFHTAFLVFGMTRIAPDAFTGYWQLVPWFLPTVVGVPATTLWVRYYRRLFREAPAHSVASSSVLPRTGVS
ncbi:MAG: hypothetical protein K1X57_18810 [Gemmataceae bacterium]|nr:hypothetical protein [Gemmataceae bacterium]